ncbi:hypothetical protein EJB05_05119 [Eragrostis curvula]|uniref:AAA+ ATPase domain-containing protein n=1 Tax=Eragrostis curvula TaxID=38414 RepID=A0A5J9WBR8_9POAL|nr:hypothetical protein EJB05_05119 [Eragrostis curvula]
MAAVVDAFASKLVDILAGMAKEEVEMLLGVPGEITKLETTLGDLSSILGDAERRRIRDKSTERWVRELKDVMYDADDILDLCQIMEGEQDPSASKAAAKSTSRCWKMPSMFFCFRNPAVAHEIGKKIQALNQRLLDLEKRSSRFGFITQSINSSAPSINKAVSFRSDRNRKTGSGIIQSDVVGEKIEQDTKKIVDLLIRKVDDHDGSNDKNVVVAAAITGTGGIGKTTLAKMVFNDTTVKENFDRRIWLSINKEVNQISVLQNIITDLGSSYDVSMGDKTRLEKALEEAVCKKRFLLVMDDVWSESENVWSEVLRVPLSHGAPGSRVLVTTRNVGVARKMKAHVIHRVDKLEQEAAWILLKKQVVPCETDEDDIDRLVDIGRRIVEKCDGLPLAIKAVGGLLLKKESTRGVWEDICNHYTWSLEGINEDINRAIYLSYEELPSHLKQCFLCCSLFPKNEAIILEDVVHLWMAEGYLQDKTSSKQPEDLGSDYYKELVSRNLLNPEERWYAQARCNMHDVVRSFAHHITGGVLVSEGQNVNHTLSTMKLRHLSVSYQEVDWNSFQKQVAVRTLMAFGRNSAQLKDLLSNLSCLRSLYLNKVDDVELPDSICHQRHLRFLRVCNSSISRLPRDIGGLKFLQAINLYQCANISQLPGSILKLQKLRFLIIGGTKITSVPRGIGKLKDLVFMKGFPTCSDDSTDGWCSLEELGPLSKLKVLSITYLEKASSGFLAARAMLSSKHHLKQLFLNFSSRLGVNCEVEANISEEEHERMEEVLANLCPPTCIEILGISGYFARGLPRWMGKMSDFGSLRRVVLKKYACCPQLPNGLGQLPFLDFLWIKRAPSVQCIGHDFVVPCSGGEGDGKGEAPAGQLVGRRQPHRLSRDTRVAFPKLRTLGFVVMPGLREWDWEEQVSGMPVLDILTIGNCKLECLPPGLAHHARQLRKLNLRNVQRLVSVENFPSVVELKLNSNPKLERISNCPSLQKIDIATCPAVKLLEGVPSLRSMEWWDLHAEALPQYIQETPLSKLRVDCSPSLLKLISLKDASSEWGKISHVQQLRAYGKTSNHDSVDRHIFYTNEPYSFEEVMGESTDSEDEDLNDEYDSTERDEEDEDAAMDEEENDTAADEEDEFVETNE